MVRLSVSGKKILILRLRLIVLGNGGESWGHVVVMIVDVDAVDVLQNGLVIVFLSLPQYFLCNALRGNILICSAVVLFFR